MMEGMLISVAGTTVLAQVLMISSIFIFEHPWYAVAR